LKKTAFGNLNLHGAAAAAVAVAPPAITMVFTSSRKMLLVASAHDPGQAVVPVGQVHGRVQPARQAAARTGTAGTPLAAHAWLHLSCCTR
jgi:hypothetical protein